MENFKMFPWWKEATQYLILHDSDLTRHARGHPVEAFPLMQFAMAYLMLVMQFICTVRSMRQ